MRCVNLQGTATGYKRNQNLLTVLNNLLQPFFFIGYQILQINL